MNWRRKHVLVLVSMALLSSCTTHNPELRPGAESGEQVYLMSCGSCHGVDARGNGPVAPFLKVEVPDLTHIARRRSGSFPAEEVYRIIDGQSSLLPHGPRNMPVWGYEFFGDDADDEVAHRRATERVELLVKYLKSIQRVD